MLDTFDTTNSNDDIDDSRNSGSSNGLPKPQEPKPRLTPDPPIESHTELAISSLTAYYDCPTNLNGYIGVYVGLANGDADWFPCPDYEPGRLYRGNRTTANPSQRTVENRIRKARPKMDTFQDATGILFVEAQQGEFTRETNKQGPMQIRVPCAPVITAIRKAITARLVDDPDADVRTVRKIAEEATAAIAPGMMGTRPRRQKDEKGEPKHARKTRLKYLRTYGAKAMAAAIEPGTVALAAIGCDAPQFEIDDTMPVKDGIKAMRLVVSVEDRKARVLATLNAVYAEAEKLGISGDFWESIDVVAGNPTGVPAPDPGNPTGVPAPDVAGNPTGVPAPDPDAWTDELCAASEKEAARIGADSGDHSYVSGTPKTQEIESPKTASNSDRDGEESIQPISDNRELEVTQSLPSQSLLEADFSSGLTHHNAWGSTLTLEDFAEYTQLPKDWLVCLGIGMRKDRRGKPYLGIPHLDTDGALLGIKQRVWLESPVSPDDPRFLWVEGSADLYGADWGFELARQRPALIICEGITDQLTFRYHHIPCVGLSCADDYKAVKAEHLKGIANIIISRDDDDAGAEMAWNLTLHLRTLGWWAGVSVLRFAEAKDASALHKLVKGETDAFKAAFNRANRDAYPMKDVV